MSRAHTVDAPIQSYEGKPYDARLLLDVVAFQAERLGSLIEANMPDLDQQDDFETETARLAERLFAFAEEVRQYREADGLLLPGDAPFEVRERIAWQDDETGVKRQWNRYRLAVERRSPGLIWVG